MARPYSFNFLSPFHRLLLSVVKIRNLSGAASNKVKLYQFQRFGNVPSGSPPCLKLETYLRMANIPYEDRRGLKPSPKGKMPWIEYKGQTMADSNFIIDFLNKEFNVDLDKDLSADQKAVSHALKRMVEENTYWTLAHYRWMENVENTSKFFSITKIEPVDIAIAKAYRLRIKKYLHGHGLGRHSSEEVHQIARDDLSTLSVCLGDKDFMMGPNPSLVDAVVFGLLTSFLWLDKGCPQSTMIQENFQNLERLCLKIRSRFWPDWEEAGKSGSKKP